MFFAGFLYFAVYAQKTDDDFCRVRGEFLAEFLEMSYMIVIRVGCVKKNGVIPPDNAVFSYPLG